MTEESEIAVVGAGLVGSLLALFLARRGFSVDLFERRPDMRTEKVAAGRSINLAISTRGITAMTRAGLTDEVLAEAVQMRGRMMHAKNGELTYQPYGKDDSECINSISRAALNKFLMSAAENTGKVKLHFQQKALGMDFDAGLLHMHDERDARDYDVRAAVVIGTDGSASRVRDDMVRRDGYVVSESRLDYGYKELVIPPGPGGTFQMEKNALHIWPRGVFMLIALPNFDGSYTCTLFLPYKGPVSFENLTGEKQVHDFFAAEFADALPLIPNLEANFVSSPVGHMDTIKCAPWNVDGRALLLGDAAHAIVPFFGQGANCGFEDLTVLEDCLEQSIDWRKIFDDLTSKRKENCDAIADMAVENFIEMRDRVGDPKFLLMKAVEKTLEKEFPGQYRSRYSLVTFSNAPYKLALHAGVVCEEILGILCRDIDRPDQVDLTLAGKLIKEKLAPLLQSLPATAAIS